VGKASIAALPSLSSYQIAEGKSKAARRLLPTPTMPTVNRVAANLPARGRRASAAWRVVSMCVMPWRLRVASGASFFVSRRKGHETAKRPKLGAGKGGEEVSEKSVRNEAISSFFVPGKDRAGPFLACRSRSGWKDDKTALTAATGSILARGREGKMEILAETLQGQGP
jgi:hypothetical protein